MSRPKSPKRQPTTPDATPMVGLGALLDGVQVHAPTEPVPESRSETKPVATAAQSGARSRVVLRKETARRGGKQVLVIGRWTPAPTPDAVQQLARELQRHCGCGGTVRDREIELQGEPVARVRSYLESKGFRVDGIC